MKDLYYCCACQNYSVEIEQDGLAEAMSKGCKWLYVYCRNPRCYALHHSDDVIAASIAQSHKIAGNLNATESVN